jgi:hypothetical protein
MALGSTQPLTEMSARNLPGVRGWPARKADKLTAICEPIVYEIWDPRRLTTLWASTACYRDSLHPADSVSLRKHTTLTSGAPESPSVSKEYLQ